MQYRYGVIDKKRNYEMPFDYPPHVSVQEVLALIEAHNLDIDAQTSWCIWPGMYIITGLYDDILAFFRSLDVTTGEPEFIASILSFN